MYVAINESVSGGRGVLQVLPSVIRKYMCNVNLDEALEIRLITGKPFCIQYPDGDYYLTSKSLLSQNPGGAIIVNGAHIAEMLERITKSSVYSVKDEIRNGYITIDGGHRVGIAGTAVTEKGSVDFIRDISAMNIRIANEVIGAADSVMDKLISDTGVKNTLIISPPCAGKTTFLRDIARSLSYKGYAVSVADERCEIAAMSHGKSSFDLGRKTSVMDNCPKAEAMIMLLRSMSPDVIVTDEIGTEKDENAVMTALNSGVAVIASIHGKNISQIKKRKNMSELAEVFDVIIVLSKRLGAGTIEEIIEND